MPSAWKLAGKNAAKVILCLSFLNVTPSFAGECTTSLPDAEIEPLANELCGPTFEKIARAKRTLNLGGGSRNEELERMAAILNTFQLEGDPGAGSGAVLMQDAGRILKEEPELRLSLKKNLILSMFDKKSIERWCRWYKRGKTPERNEKNQRRVDQIDRIMKCGIE